MVKIKYLFIDESGNLGFSKSSSRYFIISTLIIEDLVQIDKIIKNIRRNKFKKELKNVMELKATKSSENIKFYIFKQVNSLKNAEIFHIILDKYKVKSLFLKNQKHKLYNFVAGKLAQNIIIDNVDFQIIIDKSKDLFLQKEFNLYFEKLLIDKSKNSKCIKILHAHSHNYSGLQIVDFIAWSCYQLYENKNSTYNDLIQIKQEVFQVWN